MEVRNSKFSVMTSLLVIVLSVLTGMCLGTFTQSFYGLRDIDEEEIPQGAATLAFVFDITGSMYDDLVQVIEGAARILNTILARREKPIYNYVLVPFHDPDVGPVTVTTDPDLFQRHLKDLYVQGGGDCPEMSVGAVKLALDVSLPNSHVYVFTDARSKDYYLLDDVLKLIQRKESQVVFVMTGDCGNHSHPGYQAYERIASTSSGQVFHLRKSDVDEVLNFVRVSLQARKVNLLAVDRAAGDVKEFEFDIDSSLREFTVSVAGENPVVQIINSKGEIVDETGGLNDLLTHQNISIVNIKDPIPGHWKLRVGSEGPHTIRATGLSKIDFVHGFSRHPTANLRETYHRPLKGAPTYLLVNATELPESATFQSVKLIDLEGNNLQNVPLFRFTETTVFNASTFYPPEEYFYLKVSGVDEYGYPIERMTSTAISAQLPDIPEVNTRPRMNGYFDRPAELRCYIQSLVPFTVLWFKDGIQIGSQKNFPQTTEVILTIPEVRSSSEGWYSCNASNIAGAASSVIFLDVKEPPPIISKPQNVSGIIGDQVVLPCTAYSVIEHNVTWIRLIVDELRSGYVKPHFIPDVARIVTHLNGSLVINEIAKEDEGWYRCIAANEGGSTQEQVYFSVFYPPKVSIMPQKVNFQAGDTINIDCEATGFPKPIVRWVWDQKHGESFISGRINAFGAKLVVNEADPNDEGRYDCVADSAAGTDVASAFLSYIEAPQISVPDRYLLVRNGEQAVLRCIVEGIPNPDVKWYKGNLEIHPLSYIQLLEDGSLTIFGAQELDSGNYTCFATNEAGSSQESMVLNVGSIPSLIHLPLNISVEILKNGTIPCVAMGIPKPTISWRRKHSQSLELNSKYSVSVSGSLLIPNADVQDQGTYVCRAENKLGYDEAEVEIFITGIEKPELAPFNPVTDVKLGNAITLPCIVLKGNPKPEFHWLQNGKNIENGHGILTYEDGTLEIQVAEELHEAYYSCVVSNIGGYSSQETYLNVQVPPVIFNGSQEFTAIEDSPVVLPCNVEGDPKPFISWQKSGFPIMLPDDHYKVNDNGSLEIFSATEKDTGSYVCTAVNSVGVSNRAMHLIIQVPPKINQDVKLYEVVEGDTVTLPCKSYGIPPASIKWQKEGNYSQNYLDYLQLNTGSIRFRTKFSDAGNYTCVAENLVGRAVSTVTLDVFVPPNINFNGPETVVVVQGHEVALHCLASGYPAPEIHWEKDGEIVSDFSDHIIVRNDSSIHILATEMSDRGQYLCIAQNIAGSVSQGQNVIIHDPPTIQNKMTTISAMMGNEIIIPCEATGFPLPTVAWSRHDQVSLGFQTRNGSLYIAQAHTDDTSLYTCTAENPAGKDSLIFNVTVLVPPVFKSSKSFHNAEVSAGDSITLDCSVFAVPTPEVVWYKNSLHLNTTSSGHITMQDKGQRLLLSQASLSDSGKYSCEVSNIAGEIDRDFSVNVLVPPSFNVLQHRENVSVREGQALILNCLVYGNPMPRILWRRNGQLLAPLLMPGVHLMNNETQIIINHTRVFDAGVYTCIATNKVGSQYREFEVSVLVAPHIEGENFEKKEAVLHQPTYLVCLASGTPHPVLTWFKDGHMLKTEGRDKILISEDGHKLTLVNPDVSDGGLYTCTASSDIGESRKEVELSIIVPPNIQNQSIIENLKVKEGESLELSCETSGNPIPQVTWVKDGRIIPAYGSSSYSLQDEMKLKLENVNKQHAGRYTCIATNKVGSSEKDFNVIILIPPTLKDMPSYGSPSDEGDRKEVLENRLIRFSCPVSGNPPPTVVWMKNGEVVLHETDPHITILGNGIHLQIDQSQVDDEGEYICIAKNEAGQTSKKFDLNVLVPPSIQNYQAIINPQVRENSTLILSCPVTGNPPPGVTWLKDGVEVTTHTYPEVEFTLGNSVLTIPEAMTFHAGKFVCVATNIAGTAEREFIVDVLVAPGLELSGIDIEYEPIAHLNRPITLRCPISGNPIPRIQWFKEGKKIEYGTNSNIYLHAGGKKLTILRTKSFDAGLYSCLAFNDVGETKIDFDLEVFVPPMVNQSKLKSSYRIKEGESVTIECLASGNPKPIITWLKDSDVILPELSPNITLQNGNQHLNLKYATLKDSGKYTCVVGNEVGTTEQDFKLDVQVPPKFEEGKKLKEKHSAVLNRPSTISCPVTGVPMPSIKWFRNGKPINRNTDPNIMFSADGRHLKIHRTRISDAAKYTCIGINDAGRTEKEFILGIQVPPSISYSMGNNITDIVENKGVKHVTVKAVENGTVQLECHVDGSPEPIILWLKDGHLLTSFDNTSPYELQYKGQLLKIVDVQVSDAGHYTCVASNTAGTKEKNFNLDVLVPPKVKGQKLENPEALLNRPLSIECSIEAHPSPTIIWLKDGMPIDETENKFMQVSDDGRKLQLLRTHTSDQGRFSCVAENDVGRTEKYFDLNIHEPPSIKTTDTSTEAIENETVNVECLVYGNPHPYIIWLKGGEVLSDRKLNELNITLQDNNQILQILEAKSYHSGKYKCIASNSVGSAERDFDMNIKVPPQITNASDPKLSVFINRPIQLQCAAKAKPPASVIWFKDGKIVNPLADPFIHILDNGQKLQLLRARETDEGIYSCEVSNTAGQDNRSFELNVLVPPEIKSTVQEEMRSTIIEGNPVEIECYAYGSPQPTVLWLKDGKVLQTDPTQRVELLYRNQLLHIEEVEVEDGGRYTCIASSSLGSKEKHFDLIVQVPPRISDELDTNSIAKLNNPLLIHCEASGSPKPTITWMKNGQHIDPYTDSNFLTLNDGSELLIRWARISDAGKYTCIATNSAGQDEKHFDTSVHMPPVIDKSNFGPSLTAVHNHSVTLECPVSGFPIPTISWSKDGESIIHQRYHSRYQILTGGEKLRIHSAEEHDAGKFECFAFNDAGSDRGEFVLNVLVPPQLDKVGIEELLKVKEGENVVIICPVRNSDYSTAITWLKDGKFINLHDMSPHLEFSSDYKLLKIMKAQSRDGGIYKCIASNPAGDTMHETSLMVLVAPKIIEPSEKVIYTYVKQHQAINLECIVDGYPQPIVNWTRNGKMMLEEQDATYSLLRISNASLNEAGTYVCTATNEAGVDEKAYNLSVFVPATINVSSIDLHPIALQNDDAVLECPAEGYPIPRIIWYKDSQMLLPGPGITFSDDGMSIILTRLTVADAGNYICMAVNEAGDSEAEIFLTVLVPPVIEKLVVQGPSTVITNHPVRIFCDAHGLPSPQITWYKNGHALNSTNSLYDFMGDGHYLDIHNVQSSDAAVYTCHAENEAGIVDKDIALHVIVPPDIKLPEKHKNYQVIIGQPVGIECPASGDPPPSVSWLKNGLSLSDKDRIHLLENKYVLWIASAMETDAAEYTCIASNDAGTIEQNFNLAVLVPPSFPNFGEIEELSITVNNPLKIKCAVEGHPKPGIIWIKDGNVLKFSEEIYVDGTTLHLPHIQVPNSGMYICEASNVAGKARKMYHVTVLVPPEIENSGIPTFISSISDQPTVIECPTSGVPIPTIIWLKNGRPLVSEPKSNIRINKEGSELIIHKSLRGDSGSYTCLASNTAGNSSKTFVLNVLEPPKIKNGATLVKSILGDYFILACEVDGLPKPKVVWLKEGSTLSTSDQQYKLLSKGSLNIKAVRLQDSGNYTCVATNEAGSAERNVELDVLVPPIIAKAMSELKVVAGEPATLMCEVTGHPAPMVMWHKGQSVIYNNTEYNILSAGSLLIPQTTKANSGTYTCMAQNEAGSQQVNRKLEVQIPSQIAENFPEEYVNIQAQPVILKCQAEGVPLPHITWEKNGVSVDLSNPRYQILPSGDLHISLVQPSDMGLYTCIAENEAGSDTKSTTLVVQVPPVIEQNHTSNIITVKGRTIEIPCNAEGFPIPHISWQHNGDIVSSSVKVQIADDLTITNIQPEDSGNYVCVAVNSAGRDYREVNVQVHVPPTITVLPKSQDISVGDTISFFCEADGIPPPTITWLLNNTQVAGQTFSAHGHSEFIIENAGKEDQGTYSCLAQNVAGERKAVAAVRVRAPPVVLDAPGIQSVRLKEAAMLNCAVDGDPFPKIIWVKNGQKLELNHRIQQMRNGSLVIFNSLDEDSGHYKCIASNDFGAAEGIAKLVIRSEPKFIVQPRNTIVDLGDSVTMDCKVTGEPEPLVFWEKEGKLLTNSERLVILPNNSLRIVAVQVSDEAVYSCIANNSLGSAVAEAEIIVKVHGMWSQWQEWESCTVSCGEGLQHRQRFCNSPTPKNGGKICMGLSTEMRVCEEISCPVDGEWGNWLDWQECSTTCGVGQRQRYRLCNNPSPKHNGEDCVGNSTETEACLLMKCSVDGNWGSWSLWQPCSVRCGEGTQIRTRECNNPEPSHGGLPCSGESKEEQICSPRECEIHGEWSSWSEWSLCSSSCGGGIRERKRLCDSPPPAFGGRDCIGSTVQVDYCNNDACPVNGEWSEWSLWGECSASCNKGQRKRFRACNNPFPSRGGRDCTGSSQEMESCNIEDCPIDGKWGEWNQWSECSVTCGVGTRSRTRTCSNPSAANDGRECIDDNVQIEECGDEACDVLPVYAIGHLIGAINGLDIGLSKMDSNISNLGMEQTAMSTIRNIPDNIAHWMEILVPILTPIYWTTAYEIGHAANGYTLTKGFFRKETQVDFATGEILHMTHVARGLDKRGNLQIDIVINGQIPFIPSGAHIEVHPYREDYLQMGPGSIYAFSTRTYRVNDYILPYAWNHNISYDETRGKMPYLVQRLLVNEIDSHYDAARQEINYIASASISKGTPDNQCPEGYRLDNNGPFCMDIDECYSLQPCSHICINIPGSYSCHCPLGFTLGIDSTACNDIDECEMELHECEQSQECFNTIGSYDCFVVCEEGFARSYDNLYCEDIDECEESSDFCTQQCINLVGSYQCDCFKGYRLVGRSSCMDIDECHQPNPPCSHFCFNVPGSYQCSCPEGYEIANGNICKDINECTLQSHACQSGQECKNTDGSYECILPCRQGFAKALNGSCADINECLLSTALCHYSQSCTNTYGSYHCSCPIGFYSEGPGKACQDINECLQIPSFCSYQCLNLKGDYECICPPGQKRLPDKKSCAGLEYLDIDKSQAQQSNSVTQRKWSNERLVANQLSTVVQQSFDCPLGFVKHHGICQDVDECGVEGTCQHQCENVVGSFRCICPVGYRLDVRGKSCQDIDECLDLKISCGPDKMCFNMRGGFECIDTPCPPNYERDLVTGYCKLECEKMNIACPPNVKYAEILAFKMVALPSGIQAYQDLVRLVAYDQDGIHLPNTVFSIIENDTGVPFIIRIENGKGILYAQEDMESDQEYQIKVEAKSYGNDRDTVQYRTKFLVFLSVSKYPY